VWVSVKCDGTDTFTGTLEGTQAKTFAASNQVTVLVGNAGGLTIQLNGRPVGPLGARGEIQMVEFTPNGVRRVPRRPAPASPVTIPQA
jgi:cytoskeleton protein RodZ